VTAARSVCLALAFTAAAIAPVATSALSAERIVTDSAGRRVAVPERIERIFAAGPPAAIMVYTLAPDLLIGWTSATRPAEAEFMPPRYAQLPALGRLTGRGSTANPEVVLQTKPDIVLDYGSVRPTFVSLADRVQEQTRVPYLLLDGSLVTLPAAYRLLGNIVGIRDRADFLAQRAEAILGDVTAKVATVPRDKRPRVYYGRGPRGLETGLSGSINTEIIEYVGAINVAAEGAGPGGLANVSIEQVLRWNPDVVLTTDPTFYRTAFEDPLWRALPAVEKRQVFLSPALPFGWIDFPPSSNRLIGVVWLAHLLFPELFPGDVRKAARDFYLTFLHVELTDAQLDRLLAGAVR